MQPAEGPLETHNSRSYSLANTPSPGVKILHKPCRIIGFSATPFGGLSPCPHTLAPFTQFVILHKCEGHTYKCVNGGRSFQRERGLLLGSRELSQLLFTILPLLPPEVGHTPDPAFSVRAPQRWLEISCPCLCCEATVRNPPHKTGQWLVPCPLLPSGLWTPCSFCPFSHLSLTSSIIHCISFQTSFP